jgi:hypothetical protein
MKRLHTFQPVCSMEGVRGRMKGNRSCVAKVKTTAFQKVLTTFLEESGAGFENGFITAQK